MNNEYLGLFEIMIQSEVLCLVSGTQEGEY